MSPRDAPLWVRCHDLARWLLPHIAGWPAPAAALIGRPLYAEVLTLWCAVGMAGAFPARRADHLIAADEALNRARTLSALTEPGPLGAAAALHLGGELDAIGRMLGGWRRHARRRRTGSAATAPEIPSPGCHRPATGVPMPSI